MIDQKENIPPKEMESIHCTNQLKDHEKDTSISEKVVDSNLSAVSDNLTPAISDNEKDLDEPELKSKGNEEVSDEDDLTKIAPDSNPSTSNPQPFPIQIMDCEDSDSEDLEDEDELLKKESEEDVEKLPADELNFRRFKSQCRLKMTWERIFEKYGREFDSDEVDLATGQLIVDKGYLKKTPVIPMGCVMTELDRDAEETMRELYDQTCNSELLPISERLTQPMDREDLVYEQCIPEGEEYLEGEYHQEATTDSRNTLIPRKRSFQDQDSYSFQYSYPFRVVKQRLWDIPVGIPLPPLTTQSWPFNFQTEFYDTPCVVLPPVIQVVQPVFYRYIEPLYHVQGLIEYDHEAYPSNESYQQIDQGFETYQDYQETSGYQQIVYRDIQEPTYEDYERGQARIEELQEDSEESEPSDVDELTK